MTLNVGLLWRCPYRLWPTENVRNTQGAARGGVAATIFSDRVNPLPGDPGGWPVVV